MSTSSTILAIGTQAAESPLHQMHIQRRAVGPQDVKIEILYCGICHSDLHQARNEWKGTTYPCVPGHEIVGKVIETGAAVKKFVVGDLAAVGCMVDSCRECESCREGLEQYCENGATYTYNSPDQHLPSQTYGGYSQSIVVDEQFVLHVPQNLDLAGTAPLLCAGITTYSPLKHWNAGPGKKIGIIGIGGLGHMAVKLAKAMGATVVMITTSASKVADGLNLGADEVILSSNEDEMRKHAASMHLILDCVSAEHDINLYMPLLKRDGSLVLVGLPEDPLQIAPFSIVAGRKSFSGSSIGGIQETQEMLDFCSQHNITSDIEIIHVKDINHAYERLLRGDVKYRFVIDMATLYE